MVDKAKVTIVSPTLYVEAFASGLETESLEPNLPLSNHISQSFQSNVLVSRWIAWSANIS